jgi:hypothetical protein
MMSLTPTSNRRYVVLSTLAGSLLLFAGCSKGQMQGTASSYVILDKLVAASGASTTGLYANPLASDVQTGGGIVEDPGLGTFRLALKDPGMPTEPITPTTQNFITLTRYHVNFVRADGRNTPGVDVPYPFDGAMTITVRNIVIDGTFTLVRVQSKLEPPLKALAGSGGSIVISTIAEVTFYGTDQTGNPVSVMGRIGVNFADWADPK